MSNRTARRAKGRRPQRKSQRPAYAKRCSWICPYCRHKTTARAKLCGECGYRKDGLQRRPSTKDTLRAKGIEYDERGEPITDSKFKRYAVEVLQGDGGWEVDKGYSTLSSAMTYAKLVAGFGSEVRVYDDEAGEELWNSTTSEEVIE